MEGIDQKLQVLQDSRFRRRFTLGIKERSIYASRGPTTIRAHGRSLLKQRLAPVEPANDGSQTPMRGHPVFIAQHATATCCRGCLARWHGLPKGRALTDAELEHVLDMIDRWLQRQPIETAEREQPTLFDRPNSKER